MPTMRTKLYVGNLPDNYSESSLRDVFSSYGGVDQVAVIKNYAFVHFNDENEATQAVKDLNGTTIGDKKIKLEVSKNKGDAKANSENDRGRERNSGRDRDRGGDRDRDRGLKRGRDRDDRRGPPGGGGAPGLGPLIGGLGNLGGLNAPPVGPLGGLGAGLGAGLGGGLGGLGAPGLGALGGAQLNGLGILSAVNTLAAVAEKSQQMNSQQQQQQGGLFQPQQQPQQQQQQPPPPQQQQQKQPLQQLIQTNVGMFLQPQPHTTPQRPLSTTATSSMNFIMLTLHMRCSKDFPFHSCPVFRI